MKRWITGILEAASLLILFCIMLLVIVFTVALTVTAFQIGGVGVSMDAVDLWLVVSAVLFGVAALLAYPKAAAKVSYLNSVMLIAAGLTCFVVAALVDRN